jgi:hypothetical protein
MVEDVHWSITDASGHGSNVIAGGLSACLNLYRGALQPVWVL